MEITTRRAVFKSWERVALALFCSISIFAIGISVLVISVGQARQGFDTKVDGLYGLLSQALASSEAALTSFAGVYQASDGLSSTQFTLMSKRLRASYPQVQMSVYAEAIGVDERADFEAEMKANGFPDFSVKPVGADAASLNGRHLVLSYLDEMTPASAHLLGSDLATAVELGSALRHAVDDAAVVALSTDRFTTQGRNWVLLKSIYYGNIVPGSVRERRRQLQGLLIFVLDLEQLTQLGAERYPDLGWRLFARGGGVGPSQVLFEKHSTRRQTVRLPAESQNAAFSASRYFRVGRQSLALEVQAQPALVGIYVRAAATMLILGVVAFAVIVAMRSRRVARLEQDEAREALFLEREKAETTLKAIADAVMTTDAACRVRYMNPVAEALTGWTRASAEGRTLGQLFEVLDPLSGSNELKTGEGALECLAAGPTYLLRCTDGRELHVKFSISPLSDSQGRVNGAVFAFHDVSREWALTKKLVYQARHDSLTGLPNRSEFEARVRDALSHCQSQQMCHAVLYLDLDQFKLVNDTCGHPVGDRLLKQVSGRLRAAIGPGDIVARLGGDEFGVLIYDCSEEEAAEVGERLRNEVDSFRFTHADKAFDLGVSIGCVVLDEHSGSLSDILSVADMACYAAKERGRNCVHIYGADDELIAHRHREMAWSGRLRHALENHQLTLCAQRIRPCNNDGSPELVEFLLRLTEADGQSTLPMAFIPAAERYDLMPRIDRWVILEAFAAIRRLERLGERATYSINLSGQSMGDAELAQFVIDQLAMHRISPRRVCFEITETAAISNLTEALRFVHRLRAIGCRFALDDFGAGVSSFGYLRHLSPDFLKIDGQFVRDIADDPVDRALLETIVNVGKVLGIQTIAEWVEDEPTLNVLREIDVDYVQGFHVGRPTPVEMWDHKIPMPAVATA